MMICVFRLGSSILDFDIYFNIVRNKDDTEKVDYSIVIDRPEINMYNVKALLIHDYVIDDAFPSVGIFDTPIELLVNSGDKLELSGKIQTIDDISNIKYDGGDGSSSNPYLISYEWQLVKFAYVG